MPEKTVRLSEESTRPPSETDQKKPMRNSHQFPKSLHTAPAGPEMVEATPRPAAPKPPSLTPSARALPPWPSSGMMTGDNSLTAEPTSINIPPKHSDKPVDQRPAQHRPGSREYGQASEQAQRPTPRGDVDTTGYFDGRPRQRAAALSQDNASVRTTLPKYTPLPNNNRSPPRPHSILSTRQNPWEVYDPELEGRPVSNYDTSGTPSKSKPPRKRGTSFYVVRENGGDGGGPPNELLQLPFADWMQGSLRNHFVAFLGEFVGTCMFLWFAFAGTTVANIGAQKSLANTTLSATVGLSPMVILYVAVSFGFSLLVNVWVFFRVSGGLFNPAVTLGMVMTRTITYTRGLLLFAAQLIGAILASFLVKVMFPHDFDIRTKLSNDTSIAQGVFIEIVLTAELVFTIFMLAKEKHKATYMAPIGIGLALFIAEIVGVFFTGGSLNPARSFGPCVVAGKFNSEHWIYWIGPCCGTLVAYAFYRFIKILEYEMANPGQDSDHNERDTEATTTLKAAEADSFV